MCVLIPVKLTEIFKFLGNRKSYSVDNSILTIFRDLLAKFTDRIGELGNGRFVRNIFDRCIANQCNRLAAMVKPSPEALKTFLIEDIPTKLFMLPDPRLLEEVGGLSLQMIQKIATS